MRPHSRRVAARAGPPVAVPADRSGAAPKKPHEKPHKKPHERTHRRMHGRTPVPDNARDRPGPHGPGRGRTPIYREDAIEAAPPAGAAPLYWESYAHPPSPEGVPLTAEASPSGPARSLPRSRIRMNPVDPPTLSCLWFNYPLTSK